MQTVTPLQRRIATQILSHARQFDWRPGHHLTEDSLRPILGTSRTPIRAAMALLETRGVLERRPNRGFFLKALPPADREAEDAGAGKGSENVYFSIAMDRLARNLPDSVSENELIRRYGVSRAQLRLVLARIAAEGWIERRPGRGWTFQPLIDTLEAYHENYRFRQMLEPAAMRSPEFCVSQDVVARLRAQQLSVRDAGYRILGQVELFEINASFHESIAAMANNRFFTQALSRVNQLRRLMEYGRPLDRARIRRVCTEHLAILDALGRGDVAEAARRLETHLSSAAIEKAMAHAQLAAAE